MLSELVKAALTLVIGFALKWFFALIGFVLDPVIFDTLVGAIVLYFLVLFGFEGGVAGIRSYLAYRARNVKG